MIQLLSYHILRKINEKFRAWSAYLTDDVDGGLTHGLAYPVSGTDGVCGGVLRPEVHDVQGHVAEVVDHVDAGACSHGVAWVVR